MSIIDAILEGNYEKAIDLIERKHESIHEARDGENALDIAMMMQETNKKNKKLQKIVDLLEEEYEDDDYEDDEDISSIGSDGYESDDDFMIVAPGARIVDEDDAKDEKKMRENLSAALDREHKKGGKRKCTTCKNKKYKKRKDTNKKTKKNKKRKTSKKSKQSKRKSKSKKLRGG